MCMYYIHIIYITLYTCIYIINYELAVQDTRYLLKSTMAACSRNNSGSYIYMWLTGGREYNDATVRRGHAVRYAYFNKAVL